MSSAATPRIEHREVRHYVGVRARLAACEFAATVDAGWPRVVAWMARHRVPAAGAPFIRYCVLGDDDTFEIDLGVPVFEPVGGDGALHAGDSLGPLLLFGFPDDTAARREQWAISDVAELVLEHFDAAAPEPQLAAGAREGKR